MLLTTTTRRIAENAKPVPCGDNSVSTPAASDAPAELVVEEIVYLCRPDRLATARLLVVQMVESPGGERFRRVVFTPWRGL